MAAARHGASLKPAAGAKFDVEVLAAIYAKPDTWQDGFERLDQSSSQEEA